jgi:hypothetical protein
VTEFVASTLVLVAVCMCLMGFMADKGVMSGRLNVPGAYWTVGLLFLLPFHFTGQMPGWTLLVHVGGIAVVVWTWFDDVRKAVKR